MRWTGREETLRLELTKIAMELVSRATTCFSGNLTSKLPFDFLSVPSVSLHPLRENIGGFAQRAQRKQRAQRQIATMNFRVLWMGDGVSKEYRKHGTPRKIRDRYRRRHGRRPGDGAGAGLAWVQRGR